MAGYSLYFGDILFPVAPQTINTVINGRNKVYDLINDGEMNVLKYAGLTTMTFSVLLPSTHYPFATYLNGFKTPGYYLNELERLKQSRKPFQFIVSRHSNGGIWTNLHNTNMTCSLENYTVKEDAKSEGFDIVVEITLKQYKEFSTKTFTITTPSPTAPIALTEIRDDSTVPSSSNSNNNKGGGGKTKKYKVQIPGMAVVEVTAGSVQEAITKACGKNWSGTIYVDGVAYEVKNGVIVLPQAVKKAAVTGAVKGAVAAVTGAVAAVAKKTTTTKAATTGGVAGALGSLKLKK